MKKILPVACAAMALALATPAFALSASFRWCGVSSPAISIGGAPKDTARLAWMMRDAQAPAYDHGRGEVAYAGKGGIPCGALSNYRGPSPPAGQQHFYQLHLEALDAAGNVLARATAGRKFPER